MGGRRWTFITAIGILFFCSLLLRPAQAQSTFDKVKKSGKLLAGVRFDYPPIGYLDAQGKNAGFGPDIARALALKMGVQVEFVQTTSKTRIPLLQNGMIDAEIGPTTTTVKREEVIDFTIVYYWDSGTILVLKSASLNPKDYGPPKNVATTQGSYFIELFKTEVPMPNASFKLFQEYPDAVMALLNKKVDAVVLNRFAAGSFAKKYKELAVGEDFFKDPIAIGVRQNDSKWRNWLNWSLQELWRDGVYQKLYEANFGFPPNFKLWSEYGLQPGILHPEK